MIRIKLQAALCLLASVLAAAQSSVSPPISATSKPEAPQSAVANANEATEVVDLNALLRETQQMDNRAGKIGVFWWVPVEYFEQSAIGAGASPGQARRNFAPLTAYTMFVLAVGTVGFGSIDWLSEADVRKGIVLRDQAGNTYSPLEKVSTDAQTFSEVMKPMLKNILGPMGEGLQIVYFANKDPNGKEFANPHERSEFSLVVTDLLIKGKTSTYTWRLPLSSLLPPKYCPVGKERVEANWKYCPWHGHKLDDTPPPATAPTRAK